MAGTLRLDENRNSLVQDDLQHDSDWEIDSNNSLDMGNGLSIIEDQQSGHTFSQAYSCTVVYRWDL